MIVCGCQNYKPRFARLIFSGENAADFYAGSILLFRRLEITLATLSQSMQSYLVFIANLM